MQSRIAHDYLMDEPWPMTEGSVQPYGVVMLPPLRLHPKMAKRVAEKVARLEDAFEDRVDGHQAAEIIRGTIDFIVLTPAQVGLGGELRGDLAVILNVCEEAEDNNKLPGSSDPGSQLSLVSGPRNQRYLHLDHAFLLATVWRLSGPEATSTEHISGASEKPGANL